MQADAQRDGRPAEYRWCPLLNAATVRLGIDTLIANILVVYDTDVCYKLRDSSFFAFLQYTIHTSFFLKNASAPRASPLDPTKGLFPQDPLQLWTARLEIPAPSLTLIMTALWNRADHYIFVLWFLSLSFFFSSPNLNRRR